MLAPSYLDNQDCIVARQKCLSSWNKMSPLRVSEAFCYICRGVLIEPVTVPCLHVFCYTCFEQSMQETSYSCPLCRKRISNWVRIMKKNNKLINEKLWNQIKEEFREQVRLKLNGEDDGLDERLQKESPMLTSISQPGEVAQEFSKLLNDFRSERERIKQAEELASKELIEKLKQEEERELQLIQKQNISKIKKDEELARKIHLQLNKETPSTSQTVRECTYIDKIQKEPDDEYLKGYVGVKRRNGPMTIVEENLEARSTSTDSTDSIQSEMHHFKPIKVVPRTPPKQYPDGRIREISLTKVTPLKLTFNNVGPSSSGRSTIEAKKIHSLHSAFTGKKACSQAGGDNYESPSKRLKFSSEEPESGVLKEITLGENNDFNSTSTQDEAVKKKPNPVKKCTQENFIVPSKMYKYDMETTVVEDEDEENEDDENEDDENDNFNIQDYLTLDPSVEAKFIEEQRRIEQIFLQEKADRELALKLSLEWESSYELRTKPLTRLAAATKSTNNFNNKKVQQTLYESFASMTRKSNK